MKCKDVKVYMLMVTSTPQNYLFKFVTIYMYTFTPLCFITSHGIL